MVRALIIDDVSKAAVAKVLAYAQEHPYVYPGGTTPGNNPNYVAHLGSYRAVFTFTHFKPSGGVYRHLSVSTPAAAPNMYPHMVAISEIAKLFGFTGEYDVENQRFPSDWEIGINKEDHCIVLGQAIGSLEGPRQ